MCERICILLLLLAIHLVHAKRGSDAHLDAHFSPPFHHHSEEIYFPRVDPEIERNSLQSYRDDDSSHLASGEFNDERQRQHGRRRPRNQRLCEKKYAEYITRIFPDDEAFVADANETEFDGRGLAEPGEYPHMSALGFDMDNGKFDYKCGGSLISENFVITAAHCTNYTGDKPTKVRIGDLNLLVEEHYLEPQIRNIKQIYNHPQYKTTSHYNDIALLELDSDVDLTEFVRPIRLWVDADIPFDIAHAMGYGATSFAKARTNRLTDFNMSLVSNVQCNEQMPKMTEIPLGIIDSQICAHDYIMRRDTCQGDSGGPLQLNLPGKRRRNRKHYHLIGLTSFGLFCRSEYPSVYTRISSFIDWIENIVWK